QDEGELPLSAANHPSSLPPPSQRRRFSIDEPAAYMPPTHISLSEIIRLIPGLPFDIAPHARHLHFRSGLAREHRLQRRAQIFARDRNAIPRAARIELPAIHEPATAIEEKNIRRARRAISLRHRLR